MKFASSSTPQKEPAYHGQLNINLLNIKLLWTKHASSWQRLVASSQHYWKLRHWFASAVPACELGLVANVCNSLYVISSKRSCSKSRQSSQDRKEASKALLYGSSVIFCRSVKTIFRAKHLQTPDASSSSLLKFFLVLRLGISGDQGQKEGEEQDLVTC